MRDGRAVMARRRLDFHWHLRRLMAAHQMWKTTELIPLLRERGVELSASQVYRLVTDKPERLSMKVLIALCDILDCTPADLIDPYAESAARAQDRGRARRGGASSSPACGRNGPASSTRTNTPACRGRAGASPIRPGSRPVRAAASATPAARISWPEGRVCKYCYLQARLRTGTCAGCGALTSLPGLNAAGQPACTRCSGIPARFRCGCGREVTAGERGRCWWCVLAGLVTDALAGPSGEIPAHLRPLADGLVSMRRPQSGVVWLRRSAITRQALRDLARDRMPCSHAALDAAGADRAVEYLRLLLVRYGALPPRDRRLADFQRWAATKLDGIGDAGHRQLLERFLRWRLLRHLRSGSTTAGAARPRPLPAGQAALHRGDRLPGLAGRPRTATR